MREDFLWESICRKFKMRQISLPGEKSGSLWLWKAGVHKHTAKGRKELLQGNGDKVNFDWDVSDTGVCICQNASNYILKICAFYWM